MIPYIREYVTPDHSKIEGVQILHGSQRTVVKQHLVEGAKKSIASSLTKLCTTLRTSNIETYLKYYLFFFIKLDSIHPTNCMQLQILFKSITTVW